MFLILLIMRILWVIFAPGSCQINTKDRTKICFWYKRPMFTVFFGYFTYV